MTLTPNSRVVCQKGDLGLAYNGKIIHWSSHCQWHPLGPPCCPSCSPVIKPANTW